MHDENVLSNDLKHVMDQTIDLWPELRNQRLFVTGGTSFWGCWLLESFIWANDNLDLHAEAVVLTRNIDAFVRKAPHLASHPTIRLHHGDVCSFQFPPGKFSHIIHAAAETNAKLHSKGPLMALDTIVEGTRRVLTFAGLCKASKLLFASSGAVYGKQPSDLTYIPEDYLGAPNTMDPHSAYGEAKRLAENLCVVFGNERGIETKIARGFAFVGPYLPLDAQFAMGHFILSGLRGYPISIKGDGTPYRSYLYAADLAIWLWTILFRGQAGDAYNVGSEQEITIVELANMVSGLFQPRVPVKIVKTAPSDTHPQRYVPSTQKAFRELKLRQMISLEDAIKRTIRWQKRRQLNLGQKYL